MKKFFAFLSAAVLCLSMTACAPRSAAPAAMMPSEAPASAPMGDMAWTSGAAYDKENAYRAYTTTGTSLASAPGGDSPYTREDAKLIREATLSLESLEYDAAVTALDALVAKCGGYYGSSSFWGGNTYSGQQNRSADYTVRIPADRYDEFFAAVGDVARVVHRSESSTDVGAAYYDTELRLNTAKIKHERLLSLLEKADKMEDIITIETSLAQVQYEIDQLSGNLRRYDGLISFATIRVSLAEVTRITDKPADRDTFGVRMGKAFSSGLVQFSEGMARFAEWAAYNFIGLMVFLVLAAGVAVVLRRKVFPKKRKDAPAA